MYLSPFHEDFKACGASASKCFFSATIPFAAAPFTTSATEVPTAPSSAERIPKQRAKNWVSFRNRRSPAEEH